MALDIDKLRSLYIKYDALATSGDDVVTDLRKEIDNLELSVLRDYILPKIASLLYKETSDLRCNIDCSLQSVNGKIEYSFCTENSPLVRAYVTEDNDIDFGIPKNVQTFDSNVLEKITSSLIRLSELSIKIENYSSEAKNYISQLRKTSCNAEIKENNRSAKDITLSEKRIGIILYCRSQNCNAKGLLLPNRDIIVLKGSVLRMDITPTYRSKDFRTDILARYCSLTERGYIALRDLPPMSVSAASGLCLGRSSNGNVDWKDEYGIRLANLNYES